MNPLDNELTNRLRGQLAKDKTSKPELTETTSEDKARKALKATGRFFQFVLATFAVWGAQHFIMAKAGVEPFNFWQSSTILIAVLYITKFIKG